LKKNNPLLRKHIPILKQPSGLKTQNHAVLLQPLRTAVTATAADNSF